MPETQDIYISKKLSKIIDLFNDNVVTFSRLMIVWWYKNPYSAMSAVSKLINSNNIRVIMKNSTFIKI